MGLLDLTKSILKKIKNNITTIIFVFTVIITSIIAFVTHGYVYNKENKNNPSPNTTAFSYQKPKNSGIKNNSSPKSSTQKKSTTIKINTKPSTTKTIKRKNETTSIEINFPIDINEVTFEELIQIKGIGQVTANNILEYRDSLGKISNLDLLLNINGIGESTLSILKQHLYVSGEDYKETVTTTQPITTKTTATIPKQLPEEKQFKVVNINNASAKELSDSLLIDMSLAREIIALRNKISYFSNSLELLYIDNFTENMYRERKDYIVV